MACNQSVTGNQVSTYDPPATEPVPSNQLLVALQTCLAKLVIEKAELKNQKLRQEIKESEAQTKTIQNLPLRGVFSLLSLHLPMLINLMIPHVRLFFQKSWPSLPSLVVFLKKRLQRSNCWCTSLVYLLSLSICSQLGKTNPAESKYYDLLVEYSIHDPLGAFFAQLYFVVALPFVAVTTGTVQHITIDPTLNTSSSHCSCTIDAKAYLKDNPTKKVA